MSNLQSDRELARLANRVLWPGFNGTTMPAWLKDELGNGLAGVVYFSHNLQSLEQSSALSQQIYGQHPTALIGIDEEGGTVTRVESATGSSLPSASQLGFLDNVDFTEEVGRKLAATVHAVGANVVLSPVADINTNPLNPVIGVRSFGTDAELVARHVSATIDGIQESGLAACAKHWPGHGDTAQDSHLTLPRLNPGTHLDHALPFHAGAATGTDMIMSAHIVVPEWGERPATINPTAISVLRDGTKENGIGFDGVIVSDALDMEAIRQGFGTARGGVLALQAGVDLLCIGNPQTPREGITKVQDRLSFSVVQNAIIDAVKTNELDLQRLTEAGDRVEKLARRLRPKRELLEQTWQDMQNTQEKNSSWINTRSSVISATKGPVCGVMLEPDVGGRVGLAVGRCISSWPIIDLRADPTLAVFTKYQIPPSVLTSNPQYLSVQHISELIKCIEGWRIQVAEGLIIMLDNLYGKQRDLVAYLQSRNFSTVVINTGVAGELAGTCVVNTRGSSLYTTRALTSFIGNGEE